MNSIKKMKEVNLVCKIQKLDQKDILRMRNKRKNIDAEAKVTMKSRKRFRQLRVNDNVCQGHKMCQEDVFTVRKMSKNTGNKAKINMNLRKRIRQLDVKDKMCKILKIKKKSGGKCMEVVVRDVVCKIKKMNQKDILAIRKKQKSRDAEAKINLNSRKKVMELNFKDAACKLEMLSQEDILSIRSKLKDTATEPKAITTPLVYDIFYNFFKNLVVCKDTKNCGKQKCVNPAVSPKMANLFEKNRRNPNGIVKELKQHNLNGIAVEEVNIGDYVKIRSSNLSESYRICHVVSILEDGMRFHGHWLIRSCATVLNETGVQNELFIVDRCDDINLACVLGKCNVKYKRPIVDSEPEAEKTDSFFYGMWYDVVHGHFQEPPKGHLEGSDSGVCISCLRKKRREQLESPILRGKLDSNKKWRFGSIPYRSFSLNGVDYRVGDTVYLSPEAFYFEIESFKKKKAIKREVDEDIYPEYYRKLGNIAKENNLNIPQPFRIGEILAILCQNADSVDVSDGIKLKVRKFYRPENICSDLKRTYNSNFNEIYWSSEEAVVDVKLLRGSCSVVYARESETNLNYLKEIDRFYFKKNVKIAGTAASEIASSENIFHAFVITLRRLNKMFAVAVNVGIDRSGLFKAYNSDIRMLEDVLGEARRFATKKKTDQARRLADSNAEALVGDKITKTTKLRTLEIFAGCGGLSAGLHQSGVAEILWAIENNKSAAQAYQANNPKCTVFQNDCNVFLRLVLEGKSKNELGQKFPKRSDVDMICGGPPCQGFSQMNRYSSRKNSCLKNSLVVTFLSYCDYYRPKYILLENVRTFFTYNKCMVFKLTLKCLLKMGYQCSFGVLQAGSYGVPQKRRRAFIMAAAPGHILPEFPQPTHCFGPKACINLSVIVDGKKYCSKVECADSAPYRTVRVRDALSDLPKIKNNTTRGGSYSLGETKSPFQRQVRHNVENGVVHDHVCKHLSPLALIRIKHIPLKPDSDWRDLPNINVKLDKTQTKKLKYLYVDRKNGASSTGRKRGVCCCAAGKPCDPGCRQQNTLIPWSLPHTGNRHYHWAGTYGRLDWDGYFDTTVTKPNPMSTQGRVLHPSQDRIVSVRECARSQGFPDEHRFVGQIVEKYRQIGNAVPPPLAKAIGLEIKKSLMRKLAN